MSILCYYYRDNLKNDEAGKENLRWHRDPTWKKIVQKLLEFWLEVNEFDTKELKK
jgi:hypothetical protein